MPLYPASSVLMSPSIIIFPKRSKYKRTLNPIIFLAKSSLKYTFIHFCFLSALEVLYVDLYMWRGLSAEEAVFKVKLGGGEWGVFLMEHSVKAWISEWKHFHKDSTWIWNEFWSKIGRRSLHRIVMYSANVCSVNLLCTIRNDKFKQIGSNLSKCRN